MVPWVERNLLRCLARKSNNKRIEWIIEENKQKTEGQDCLLLNDPITGISETSHFPKEYYAHDY